METLNQLTPLCFVCINSAWNGTYSRLAIHVGIKIDE